MWLGTVVARCYRWLNPIPSHRSELILLELTLKIYGRRTPKIAAVAVKERPGQRSLSHGRAVPSHRHSLQVDSSDPEVGGVTKDSYHAGFPYNIVLIFFSIKFNTCARLSVPIKPRNLCNSNVPLY